MIGLPVEFDRVALDELAAFARFRFPVDLYQAVADGLLGFASTGNQAFEFKQLAELDAVRVDRDSVTRIRSHELLEKRRSPVCRRFFYLRT